MSRCSSFLPEKCDLHNANSTAHLDQCSQLARAASWLRSPRPAWGVRRRQSQPDQSQTTSGHPWTHPLAPETSGPSLCETKRGKRNTIEKWWLVQVLGRMPTVEHTKKLRTPWCQRKIKLQTMWPERIPKNTQMKLITIIYRNSKATRKYLGNLTQADGNEFIPSTVWEHPVPHPKRSASCARLQKVVLLGAPPLALRRRPSWLSLSNLPWLCASHLRTLLVWILCAGCASTPVSCEFHSGYLCKLTSAAHLWKFTPCMLTARQFNKLTNWSLWPLGQKVWKNFWKFQKGSFHKFFSFWKALSLTFWLFVSFKPTLLSNIYILVWTVWTTNETHFLYTLHNLKVKICDFLLVPFFFRPQPTHDHQSRPKPLNIKLFNPLPLSLSIYDCFDPLPAGHIPPNFPMQPQTFPNNFSSMSLIEKCWYLSKHQEVWLKKGKRTRSWHRAVNKGKHNHSRWWGRLSGKHVGTCWAKEAQWMAKCQAWLRSSIRWLSERSFLGGSEISHNQVPDLELVLSRWKRPLPPPTCCKSEQSATSSEKHRNALAKVPWISPKHYWPDKAAVLFGVSKFYKPFGCFDVLWHEPQPFPLTGTYFPGLIKSLLFVVV